MVSSLIRWTAIATSVLVALSFACFTVDQLGHASEESQAAVVERPTSVLPIATKHAQPRRFIDSAARTLLSPFEWAGRSTNDWARRGGPTLLALLVYGLGLGFLSRAAEGIGRKHGRQPQATFP